MLRSDIFKRSEIVRAALVLPDLWTRQGDFYNPTLLSKRNHQQNLNGTTWQDNMFGHVGLVRVRSWFWERLCFNVLSAASFGWHFWAENCECVLPIVNIENMRDPEKARLYASIDYGSYCYPWNIHEAVIANYSSCGDREEQGGVCGSKSWCYQSNHSACLVHYHTYLWTVIWYNFLKFPPKYFFFLGGGGV